jgi:hypothetical protein
MATKTVTIPQRTQLEALELYMTKRRGGSISPAEAKQVFGIERLAARVLELRAKGHNVVKELRHDARGKRYARYRIVPA